MFDIKKHPVARANHALAQIFSQLQSLEKDLSEEQLQITTSVEVNFVGDVETREFLLKETEAAYSEAFRRLSRLFPSHP